MIKCIVIDDEPLALKLMSNYVNKHENLKLVGNYLDPIKALHEIENIEVDLIFLDIQMPQLSGIQFLKILNNRIPIILTTAYDEYALESYDFQVIDYLLKPFNYERFSKAIDKFKAFNISKEIEEKPPSHREEIATSIFVKSGHKTIRIELNTVHFMESKGDYLYIFTNGNITKTLENLKDIMQRLSPNFLRCHRSFIVNMDLVDYIENNRITMGDNFIPISRAYLSEVQSFIQDRKH